MTAPVRHRIELYAVRELHLVFCDKPLELPLRLCDPPISVRLCIPLSAGDKAIKLDATASVI